MVDRMAWTAGALLLAMLVAGCSTPEAAPAADPAGQAAAIQQADDAAAQVAVEATPTTGVIRGVVVDEAIRPLAGVFVALEGTTLNRTTNAQGAFGFEDLPAGTHFLAASFARYQSVRIGVVVQAGVQSPEPTRVVMSYVPGQEPFVEAFEANLFVAFSSPIVGAVGGSTLGVDESDYRVAFTIQPNATVIQMEVTWDPVAPTAEHAYLFGSASEGGTPLDIHTAVGSSPLAIRVNGTAENDVADGFYFGVEAVPRAFTSLDPPDPNGILVVNQPYQGFAHVFHNYAPPTDWLFVRDGAYPAPT